MTDPSAGGHADNPWLLRLRSRPDGAVRLYCFPHGGGGASAYRPWVRVLPPTVELFAVALPGREHRLGEPAGTDLARTAAAVAEAVRAAPDRRPFALFGHSSGSLLALETARLLTHRYRVPPVLLAVSGAPAPHRAGWRDPRGLLRQDPRDVLQRLGGVPEPVLRDPELGPLAVAAMRADLILYGRYRYPPQPPLGCPISVFGGADDPLFPPAARSGWRSETTAGLTGHGYPGGHFYLRERLAELIADLATDLAAALAR